MKNFKDVKALDKKALKNVKGGKPAPYDGSCPEGMLLCFDRITCVEMPSQCPC